MGREPLDLAAPEIADMLGVPPEVIEDWMARQLLPSEVGEDGVRRATRRTVVILRESRGLDAERSWSEAEWEALLERLGPVLRDQTSLRPSLLGRILDQLPWIS